MKLVHLSDLHLGKRLNEYSLLEDQRYILAEIVRVIDAEAPDGVIVAGDVYDKSMPSAEAVELLDDFLVSLVRRDVPVFVISGNHDSPERLAFGGRIMDARGVHLSPVYDGKIEPLQLKDAHGAVNLYLLPFLRPAHVRRFFPQEEIASYTDALRVAIGQMDVDPAARNVLVTHQFVTGAARSDSEEISVGGSDNVDSSVFDGFDYVALGHIHAPQDIGSARIRYCGTPLKYSLSEARQEKSVTVVELGAKGELAVRTAPLHPLRDLRQLKGTYLEVTSRAFYEGTTWPEDYVHITLTDEEDVPDAASKLHAIYGHMTDMCYDNTRTRARQQIEGTEDVERKSPLELFARFYELQNNQPMSEAQAAYMRDLIERVWEVAQ